MSIVQFLPAADYHYDYHSDLMLFLSEIFLKKCLSVVTRNNLTEKWLMLESLNPTATAVGFRKFLHHWNSCFLKNQSALERKQQILLQISIILLLG